MPPPLSTWDPHAELLAMVVDAVRSVSYTVAKSNGDKKMKPPQPVLRPETGIAAARHRLRVRQHESLADRLLPNRKRNRQT